MAFINPPAFSMLAAAPSPSPWLEPPRGPDPPPVEPISITIIAIGALAGIIFIGAMCYLFCTRWTQLKDDSAWLPKDASRAEVLELMELIRVGTVDANGAPLHVINWMVHGADAPWPPPDGIKSLQKRRKGSCTMARSWINSSAAGASIELPQRIQPRRPREQSTMDLSTHYARKAELVSSHHYSAADIPQEYPLLPPGPNPHCQASAKILSHSSKQFLNNGAVEAETVMSPYTEISLHVDSEFESEVGSRRTTLREDGDLPFTALSPRPLSPRLHRQGCYLSLED